MIGSRLGNWILDSELGRGGMGTVYLAHDAEQPERLAAVKVLAGELTTHAGSVHRFQREIEVLSKLNHPNIVRLFDSGTYEGLLYYVMEYVQGNDFADLLEDQERLEWPEVLGVAIQVCGALKHAHDHGVIHRDLKPSNLMRTPEGVVKLADFGVAHVFAGKHLTRTGAVVGTAEYLSPEQAEGKPATKRSDLYSLGCVLYTFLCGKNPFAGDNVVDLLHKHRYAQFDPPAKLVRDLPHELDEIICQLLEKDPAKRPPDAGILQRRLEALRAKLEHRGDPTQDAVVAESTQIIDTLSGLSEGPFRERGEGPATLMSRLLRKELDQQNHGGPVRQLLNRPTVIILLLLVCAVPVCWKLWPTDPEKQYLKGQSLLESDNPEDWTEGWELIQKAQPRLPEGAHAADIARYQQKVEEYQAARRASWQGERLSEAQWFYQQGVRQRQQGQNAQAKETWRNLVRSFRDVPAERRWVRLAEKQLEKDNAPADARRFEAAHQALEQARRLRADGQTDEADALCAALEQLYRDDPSARDLLEEVRREKMGSGTRD